MKTLARRTFAAVRHPKGSPERDRLNLAAETSEYFPSHKWVVVKVCHMSDGTINPSQPTQATTFRTKQEAEAAFDHI